MASIAELGIGYGLIYVTLPNGTTFVKTGVENIAENVPSILQMGVGAASTALNKRALGTITFTVAPTGNGSLSAVTIGAVNQIADAIAYTSSDTTITMATKVATAINSFAPASGYDYRAVPVGSVVYIIAPVAAGSAPNGSAITVTVSTNPPTYTTADLNGGSDNTNSYSESWGLRFFLNANYDADGCACGGTTAQKSDLTNAIEITNYIVNLGLQSSLPLQSASIVAGALTVSRRTSIQYVTVDTESSAASDDLDSIIPSSDFVDGDILIINGASASRVVSITNVGNLLTSGSFSTGAAEVAITLRYSGGLFQEISRAGGNYVPSLSALRAAGYPLTSEWGVEPITAADNTTVTLTVAGSKRIQHVTGTVSLTTGNYEIEFSNTGAIRGDEFTIIYDAAITIGSYKTDFGGRELTAAEALGGGVILNAVFNGSTWDITMSPDTNAGYLMNTANIAEQAITTAKLATALTYEVIVFDISFESGEQGDYKIKMPYAGSVSEFYARVTHDLAATNSGTITPKDNGGTTMTDGVMTFAALDPFGTAVTTTPTANNTFVAGDLLTFTSQKTTAGGKAQVSMKIIRA